MKNKVMFLFLLFGLLFGLAACGGSSESVKKSEILAANLEAAEAFEHEFKIESLEIPSSYLIDTSFFSRGFLIAYDEIDFNKQVVYSLYTKKIIFGPREDSFVTAFNSGPTSFLHVHLQDLDVYHLYDVFGNLLIEMPLDTYNTSYETYFKNDDEGELVGYYHILYLSYLYYDEDEADYFYEDVEFFIDLQNQKLSSREESGYGHSGMVELEKYYLDSVGLPKHYVVSDDAHEIFYVYNNKDKLINTIYLPSGYPLGIINGHMFIQHFRDVIYENDTNYSFIDSYGDRYLHWIERIDLLTGKSVELKLDYLIDGIMETQDKKGNYKYGLAQIQHINNKMLDDNPKFVIINKNGDIVTDFLGINPINLVRLHNNYYYSYNSEFLYNNNLEPLFSIPYFVDAIPEQELIIYRTSNHKYGMMDYEGNIVFEPKYDAILPIFSKEKVFAYDSLNSYLLSYDGVETKLDDDVNHLMTGLLYRQSEHFELLDFNLNSLIKIDNAQDLHGGLWMLNSYLSDNNYRFKFITKDNGEKVIIFITN